MTTDVRQLLVDACRILAANGQEHFAFGHVSARDAPGADRFWFKGRGRGLGDLRVFWHAPRFYHVRIDYVQIRYDI